MKLSFSTKGWHGYSFEDFCKTATETGFCGIELHNIHNELFTAKDGAFHDYASAATLRKLYSMKLSVPCIDAICDISDSAAFDECIEEITACMEIARNLKIANIRLRTDNNDVSVIDNVKNLIDALLGKAEEIGVTLIIETAGVFASSAVLRNLLEHFASDNLAALWSTFTAYVGAHETPEQVITNLGAFVRHVHLCDGIEDASGNVTHTVLGEGEMPIREVMKALRSVNYDGFLSLVWSQEWCPEFNDIEIVLPQFSNFMRQFDDLAKGKHSHYHNRTGTGEFIWKKEEIIDATFSDILDRTVEEFPDQYAFKYTTLDYTRTYEQFRDDVDEFARTLVALGVKKGTHVAVWASNVPQWYITFWASVKIGAVLVTVNTAYKRAELEYLLKQSDTHTLVMTEGAKDTHYGKIVAEICPELAEIKPGTPLRSKRLPFLRNVITVGYRQAGCLEWNESLRFAERVPVEEIYRMASLVSKDDVANMQYTSGTTGFPKGVMLTHHNIVNNGKCIGDRMDLSTADRMMVQVPMFHCFGMVLAMTASMTHATTLLPIPYFSPKPSLACINNEHITAFHGVPTMFIALLEHEDFPKTDFSYMRTGIMAGSPCPVATMQDVVNKMNMKEITIVYGLTESSPGCTMSSTDDSIEVRVNTVGRPLPGVECRIVDPETGLECPDGTTGEFCARGYNIMKGYYKMPGATAAAIDEGGWLHSGDVLMRTPEGNFRVTGRLKDMIIRGGENIYPKEIEDFIYTHPKVSDVQVIGVPDEQYGEEAMACIIPKAGVDLTEEEIRQFLVDGIARHKVPKYIDFVESFPMNAAGKILKYKMREDAVQKLGLQKADGVVTA